MLINDTYSDKNIGFSTYTFYLCRIILLIPSLSKATLIRLTGSISIGRTQMELRACLKFFVSLQMARFRVNFVPKMLM